MFIFRYEHNRDLCQEPFYATGGESLTGHGSIKIMPNCASDRPWFGANGWPPRRIMPHERCAVTADQFNLWVGNFDQLDKPEWDLIAYWVDDEMYRIDWREDCGQLVFNPEFAINFGKVTLQDVFAFQSKTDADYEYLANISFNLVTTATPMM